MKAVMLFLLKNYRCSKKHGTTIFKVEIELFQLSIGGPYQATGGMGDTLAGMIAGFTGRPQNELSLLDRVTAAVYLHSAVCRELSKMLMWSYQQKLVKKIP